MQLLKVRGVLGPYSQVRVLFHTYVSSFQPRHMASHILSTAPSLYTLVYRGIMCTPRCSLEHQQARCPLLLESSSSTRHSPNRTRRLGCAPSWPFDATLVHCGLLSLPPSLPPFSRHSASPRASTWAYRCYCLSWRHLRRPNSSRMSAA